MEERKKKKSQKPKDNANLFHQSQKLTQNLTQPMRYRLIHFRYVICRFLEVPRDLEIHPCNTIQKINYSLDCWL